MLELPPDFTEPKTLRAPTPQRPDGLVRARLQGQPVAVRLSLGPASAAQRTELAVLAALDHPGLAGLVDVGVLPGGKGTYVARRWIEGEDLGSWSEGRDPREIGAAVARLCPALEQLHRHGFVHGDLKPENVIVTPSGQVVVTDFDLAASNDPAATDARTGSGVSGSLFALAPEVLRGLGPTPRSDLFAIGVLLHELLIGARASAQQFYGRFPQEDYFAATETNPEQLPEWARDVVSGLLERDPTLRPSSAEELGRTLAARLSLSGLFEDQPVSLRWPAERGRRAWIEGLLERLERGDDGTASARWVRVPAGERPEALASALCLSAAVRGLPVARVDVAAELADVFSEAALLEWARARCEALAGCVAIGHLAADSAWGRRGAEALAAVAGQGARAGRPAPANLTVLADADEPNRDDADPGVLAWTALEAPAVGEDELRAWLESAVDAPPESLDRLTAALWSSSRGSATAIDAALTRACRGGWLIAGDGLPTLRAGRLPAGFDAAQRALPDLSPGALELLARLEVCGGAAGLEELARFDGEAPLDLGPAIAELVDAGLAAPGRSPGEAWALAGALPPAPIGEDRRRALHAARATWLEQHRAGTLESMAHRWRAAAATAADVLHAIEDLLDRGYPELALQLGQLAGDLASEGIPIEVEVGRALAWCALGHRDQAERIAEGLAPTSDPQRALVERLLARIASLGNETAAALEHLERAQLLDPGDGGEARLARARLLMDAGQHAQLLELMEQLRASGALVDLRQRNADNLRAMVAVAHFRAGELGVARTQLTEQLREARQGNDALREAGLRINLGTLERRAGLPDLAAEHLEAAVTCYERAGQLHGLARARAMLGGLRRDRGEVRQAVELLTETLAAREQLGDRVGAVAARGMLGLAKADQGVVRPALALLEESAATLERAGRSRDAQLLSARAMELRARLGTEPGEAVREDDLAGGDPRILLARARTWWLRGERERALSETARGAELSEKLGLGALTAEFELVRAGLERRAFAGTPTGDEERLAALLGHAPFQEADARALAERLEQRGRLDRAARLWIACAVRGSEDEREACTSKARRLLAACATGATEAEQTRLRNHLLGHPDPWPEDLEAFDQSDSSPESFEMDVIELLEINHRLVTQEDLGTLLGTIVENAISVSGAQRGFLILEEDGELKVDTALDSLRGGIGASEVEVSGSVLSQALEAMRPVRVSNAIDDPLLAGAPSVVNLELRSILCTPFEVTAGLRGVIYVDHRLREAAFDERVERLLAVLADQAALAIQQVRRLQEIRQLNRRLEQRVARQASDLEAARARLRTAGLPQPVGGLIGDSEPIRRVNALIERAAQTDLAVLVSGESGTGKELAARALHDLGPRASGPFESENCAAIPATLIEAELFGARRGAFTGADRNRPGLFERAHGGTVFLDEIGDLPLELQSKLLRVLETGQVRRLGDSELRDVDFRLVAATNVNLGDAVRDGAFRADLFYRLDGLRIEMPALRSHMEDLPLLIAHFMRLREQKGEPAMTLEKSVLKALSRRAWPGNVRELFNELSRLCVLSDGTIDDPELVRAPDTGTLATRTSDGVRSLADLEREAIEHAIEACGGDKNEAARQLGISRAKIYQRIKQWRGEAE